MALDGDSPAVPVSGGVRPAADPDLLAECLHPALRYDWAGRICGSTLTAAEAAESDH